MRGQEPLLKMRRKGHVPTCVFIDVDDAPSPLQMWRGWELEAPVIAQLMVEPTDAIERLDLRCVIGLRVHIHGDNEDRVQRVFEACRKAGAEEVRACVCLGEFRGGEYRTTAMKTVDPQGEQQWHTC